MEEKIFYTLEQMKIHGGSFVRNLAFLYYSADVRNKARILETFKEYFEEYERKVTER